MNNNNLTNLIKLINIDWQAVAIWKWIANDDNCGICRNAFDGCCTECKMPGDDCPLGRMGCCQNN